jgi:hypothetical protein
MNPLDTKKPGYSDVISEIAEKIGRFDSIDTTCGRICMFYPECGCHIEVCADAVASAAQAASPSLSKSHNSDGL